MEHSSTIRATTQPHVGTNLLAKCVCKLSNFAILLILSLLILFSQYYLDSESAGKL